MPAGTAIIGRVAVKVIPDTSKFKEELRGKLDKDEKSAPPFQVNTTIDMKGALIGLREGLLKINEQNKNMDSRKIKFRTTISSIGMPSAINQAVRELNALAANKEINFRAGTIGTGTVEVQLSQASLDQVKKEMDHWVRANSPLKIPVHVTWTSTVAAVIAARLAVLTRRRTVPIVPTMDNKALLAVGSALAALAGARFLQRAGSDIGEFLRDLDKAAPAIAGVGLALVTLTGFGLTAASNILAFGSSLLSIGPTALALPGILGGTAIGIGVMVAALKDFNKIFPDVKASLSSLQDVISNNFWVRAKAPMRDLIDNILPALRSGFGQTATQLGGFFGSLATSIKSTLVSKLAGMFADLSKSIDIASTGTKAYAGIITTLGQVGAGYLPRLAQAFVNISVRFDNFLAAAAADGRLQGWIDTGIIALKDLGRVIGNIAGIFSGLTQAAKAAGGSTFGIMADTLERVNRAVSSPGFQTGLTSVLFAAHQAFQAIATQSGPGVSAFFDSLGKVLVQILPGVGTAIGSLLDGVGKALSNPAFTGGIVAMFAGISTAVNALAPAFVPLGAALGALGPLIGVIVTNLAPLITALIVGLTPSFVALVQAITPLIPILGGALLQIITSLTPVVSVLVDAFAALVSGGIIPALTAAISALVPVIAVLAPVLGTVIVTALQTLTPLLPGLAQAFTVLMVALAPLIPVIGTVLVNALVAIAPLIPGLATAFVNLVTAAAPLIPIIGPILLAAINALLPVVGALTTVLATFGTWLTSNATVIQTVLVAALVVLAINWAATAVAAATSVVIQAVNFAIMIAGYLAMGISATASAIVMAAAWLIALGPIALVIAVVVALVVLIILNWDTVKNATVAVWNAISGAISAVWNFLKDFVSGAVKAVVGFAVDAWNNIQSATTSAFNTVKEVVTNAISAVVNFVTSLPGKVVAALSNLGSSLYNIASSAFNTFSDAVNTGVAKVIGFFTGIGGKILDSMGDLGGVLSGAGRKIIEGLISGITGAFGKVKETLSNLTSSLPSWKGPPRTDAVILVNAGQLVIGGFIDGLESRYDDVKKSLAGLSMEIGKTTIAAPDVSDMNVTGKASMAVNSNLASQGAASQRTLIYNAAPGSSLSSEESLWAAADRARMVGW